MGMGLSAEQTEIILQDMGPFHLARTRDPVLMGESIAAATLAEELLFDAEEMGVGYPGPDELAAMVNFRAVKSLGDQPPFEAMAEWLDQQYGFSIAPSGLDDDGASATQLPLDGSVDLEALERVFDRYRNPSQALHSLMEIEGFLCAILASPRTMSPLDTMDGVLGSHETQWKTEADLNDFMGNFLGWSDHLAQSLGGATSSFSPLFEGANGDAYSTAVAEWCMGFVRGWIHKFGELPKDELAHAVIVMVSLSNPSMAVETTSIEFDGREYEVDPKSVVPLVKALFKYSRRRSDWLKKI